MDSPVTVREGRIFWRGYYKHPLDAKLLADAFESTPKDDWYAPILFQYAADLRAAIKQLETVDA